MVYNFDEVVNRRGTDSLKYDFAQRRGMPEDILPLWVADMDFRSPPEVIEALVERCEHGIFGYSEGQGDYFDAVYGWFNTYYNWQVKREWLIKTPGVVYAIAQAIQSYTEVGDGVLIQEPVYYPFRASIEANDRQVVVNQLVYDQGAYSIDFEDFEQKILENKVKLFVLCSPHNPVGRVWTEKELMTMGQICLKNNVLVLADEIHADFTYPAYEHHVFAKLNEDFEKITITCTSPSKTFNLAGLQLSNVFIADRSLRRIFRKSMTKSGYSQPNVMGLLSCSAAYSYGHDWLKALKIYLKANLDFLKDTLEKQLPQAVVVETQGTYLVWVDCSKIPAFRGWTDKEIDSFMVKEAKLWLDGGTMFGAGGGGFQRFNIACTRATLDRALNQLVEAISAYSD